MIRRRPASLAALVVATALASPVAAAVATGHALQAQPASGQAVTELAGCLSASHAGDLLLLVDQSGSLQQTDPQHGRVQAAQYLLRQLARATATSGTKLDVAVAGFDAAYQQHGGWSNLTPDSLGELEGQVQEFAGLDTGIDTDYPNALSGARDALREKSRGTTRCQAVLWFTDGQFDLETRRSGATRAKYGTTKDYAPGVQLTTDAGSDEAKRRGLETLCRQGGVVDQLRANGVLTFGVALGSPGTNFSLMRAASTGASDGGTSCGGPTSGVVGDFYPVANVDDFVFAINALGDPGNPPVQKADAVCAQPDACDGHQFVLDASIHSVQVLAGADRAGVDVVLVAPSGERKSFTASGIGTPSSSTLDGQDVRATWLSDKTLDVSVTQKDAQKWTGQWSVVFVNPAAAAQGAKARTQVRIQGDLVPVVLNAERLDLRTGDKPKVSFGLRSEAVQQPVAADQVLGSALLSASFLAPGGKEVPLLHDVPAARLGDPVTFDLTGVNPGQGSIRMALSVVTAAVPAAPGRPALAGTALAQRVAETAFEVQAPLNYPTVAAGVDFGAHEYDHPLQQQVEVGGPGCVWFDVPSVKASPDGVGTVTARTTSAGSAASCLRVPAGRTERVMLELSLQHAGNGTVAGQLTAHLAPLDAPDRAITRPLAFVADVTKPQDKGAFWLTLLIGTVFGLALPLVFLYLVRWWTARIPPAGLAVGVVPVDVGDSDVTRAGAPVTFSGEDVSFVGVESPGARRLSPMPGVELQTRSGLNPAAAPYTQVTAPGNVVVTSWHGDRLPLAVHGSWLALVAEPARRDVRIVLLLATTAGQETYDRVAREIRERLPREVERQRNELGPVTQRDAGVGADAWAPTAETSGDALGWTPSVPEPVTGSWSSSDVMPETPLSAPATPAPAPPPSAAPSSEGGSSGGGWWPSGH